MHGLMQEVPLDVAMVARRAERLFGWRRVVTREKDSVRATHLSDVVERARRLVAALGDLGVREGDRVATFSWNTQRHLEAYVAIPCAGAVLHTLNIRLFDKDLAYIVEHADDRVVIVDRSLWPAWEKVASKLARPPRAIVVNDDHACERVVDALDYEELIGAHSPAELKPARDERQAAAMCYTSGTTGKPKGVVYSHRSTVLHSFALLAADSMALSERDVVLPIVPMFHANAWGLPYGALLAGAELVLPGRFMTPPDLCSLILEQGVTLAAGVPTIWIAALDHLRKEKARLGKLSRIICGGSAVPPSLQKSYRDELGVSLMQLWGMTETSPTATVARASPRHEETTQRDAALASQGRPLPLIEIRITGDDGREVAWDGKSVGELEVRGNWIAREYFNDPGSPERFHDGWLRTGDVASIDEHGYMRIADRTKDLVKSGGEWISSVELEVLIMAHPGVAEAAVVAVPHERWSERPLACVVARPDAKGKLGREDILEWLRPRVAKWWLPDDVVFIDEIPRTSVGKFDKKVLRERFKDHRLPS